MYFNFGIDLGLPKIIGIVPGCSVSKYNSLVVTASIQEGKQTSLQLNLFVVGRTRI